MSSTFSERAHTIAATARQYIGSTRFRHRYRPIRQSDALLGWRVVDVANDGDDSCASFASHVLVANGLMRRTRSTIGTMLGAMEQRGWFPADEAAIGAIALWGFREDVQPDETGFGHSGIVVGDGLFVSHSSFERTPIEHLGELRDGRQPVAYYAHDALFTPALPQAATAPLYSPSQQYPAV
ncbi:MAG TPA: hypothetical protein VLH86_05915 [Patescibacteria group bacterium]|nr:hypothetical protein [Patescibacteria group bacterium]